MIYYVVLARHRRSTDPLLYFWARDLRRRMTVVTYEDFAERTSLEPGTYIFSDIEGLTREQRSECGRLWSELGAGPSFHALNHPVQTMGRFDLLTAMHEEGINCFRVYRLAEIERPERFPVFVRREDFHKLLFPLIHSQAEFDDVRRQIGDDVENYLLIEYCDTSGEDGQFRKYSSYCVGPHIIPVHIMFSKDWYVKSATSESEHSHRLEWDYLKRNPHEQQLREIFRTARIEYGRIDYGLLGERIQVWEINTNSGFMPLRAKNRIRGVRPRFLQRLREARDPRQDLKLHFLRQYRAALSEL